MGGDTGRARCVYKRGLIRYNTEVIRESHTSVPFGKNFDGTVRVGIGGFIFGQGCFNLMFKVCGSQWGRVCCSGTLGNSIVVGGS